MTCSIYHLHGLLATCEPSRESTHANRLRAQADWNEQHGSPAFAAHYEGLADSCDVEVWDIRRRLGE